MTEIEAPTARFFAPGPGKPHLLGGYSPTSGLHHFPLADCCPYTGVEDIEPGPLPRTGRLLYWTAVTIAPPGYQGPIPYGLGVVALDGMGLQLVTRLANADPAALALGMAMELTVELLPANETEFPIWSFRMAGDQT